MQKYYLIAILTILSICTLVASEGVITSESNDTKELQKIKADEEKMKEKRIKKSGKS